MRSSAFVRIAAASSPSSASFTSARRLSIVEAVSEIESKLEEVRSALDGDDASTIRTKAEDLMQASHKLAEAVYQRVQAEQQATAGTTSGDGAGSSDEEVVEEADYEVIDEEAKKS